MPIVNDFDPGLSHPFYFMRRGLLDAVRKWAPSLKGKLLDFGCGSKPYRSLFNVDEYIGLDFEKTGHDHTGEEIDVFYDGKTIPFPDDYFDSILCSEVIEHLFDLPSVLKEMKRVLKKGGKLLFTCPFVWGEHEAPYDFARYTQYALRDIFKKEGFEIIQYEKRGNYCEAIAQMRILYFLQWAEAGLQKLSFIGRLFKRISILMFNLSGKIKSWLFPKRFELYLSNVLLLEKS